MSDSVTLLHDSEVQLGIPLSGYRLFPGFRGEVGLPTKAFLRLFAVGGDDVIEVTPDRLSALVERIETEDEAWRFLRLFTSRETHHLFRTNGYVIDLLVDPSRPGGVTKAVAERIGYLEPELRREGTTFFVRRDLVSVDAARPSASPAIVRRRESLSQDGEYRVLDEQEIARLTPGTVNLPYYE